MNQLSEQGTTVYPPSTVEQIVSSTLFFPSSLNDWFNLELNIWNPESVSYSKIGYRFLFAQFKEAYTNIFDSKSLKFLTSLRLGYSHFNEHRFRHNFQDCLNPLCSCSLKIEVTSHYHLHCHHFSHHCVDFMNSVKLVCDNFESMSDNVKKDLLLFGDTRFDKNKNKVILKAGIGYIKIMKDSPV